MSLGIGPNPGVPHNPSSNPPPPSNGQPANFLGRRISIANGKDLPVARDAMNPNGEVMEQVSHPIQNAAKLSLPLNASPANGVEAVAAGVSMLAEDRLHPSKEKQKKDDGENLGEPEPGAGHDQGVGVPLDRGEEADGNNHNLQIGDIPEGDGPSDADLNAYLAQLESEASADAGKILAKENIHKREVQEGVNDAVDSFTEELAAGREYVVADQNDSVADQNDSVADRKNSEAVQRYAVADQEHDIAVKTLPSPEVQKEEQALAQDPRAAQAAARKHHIDLSTAAMFNAVKDSINPVIKDDAIAFERGLAAHNERLYIHAEGGLRAISKEEIARMSPRELAHLEADALSMERRGDVLTPRFVPRHLKRFYEEGKEVAIRNADGSHTTCRIGKHKSYTEAEEEAFRRGIRSLGIVLTAGYAILLQQIAQANIDARRREEEARIDKKREHQGNKDIETRLPSEIRRRNVAPDATQKTPLKDRVNIAVSIALKAKENAEQLREFRKKKAEEKEEDYKVIKQANRNEDNLNDRLKLENLTRDLNKTANLSFEIESKRLPMFKAGRKISPLRHRLLGT